MPTARLSPSELVESYLNGESASSIARRHSVSVWSIITRLRKSGVEIRTNQNERRLGEAKTTEYSFLEVVDGILLGDGQIDRKNTLHLEQAHRREGWLLDLKGRFPLVGGSVKIIPVKSRTRIIEGRELYYGGGFQLYTPAYVELKEQRSRWYPRNKKRVPDDLCLTSMALAQWFCGDGTYGTNSTLALCTQNFPKKDVLFLIQKLQEDLGIYSTLGKTPRRGQYRINILRWEESLRVRDLIALYVPECCQYKFKYLRPGKFSQLRQDQVQEIRVRVEQGENISDLAQAFDKSHQTIRNVVIGRSHKRVK